MTHIKRADHVVVMRTCSHCGELKLATAYATDSKAADGLQSMCRVCKRASREAVAQAKARAAAALPPPLWEEM